MMFLLTIFWQLLAGDPRNNNREKWGLAYSLCRMKVFLGWGKKDLTEADLMRRAWMIIDNCFDYGAINVISDVFDNRQGEEYVSKASSARISMNRSLATMSRKKIGTKTDILFTTEYLEFDTVKAGKISDINSTKFCLNMLPIAMDFPGHTFYATWADMPHHCTWCHAEEHHR
ncbi:hypothetical protein BDC45DRAFT_561789 [Circinella umbellata]|nr:hypothetical protein BDC45DRAFT_561789 [Circinella umbellata]